MSTQTENKNSTDVPPSVALLQMVTGYWVSQTIYVAAKLRIADLLKDGPKSCDELAKATETHARSLYRLLRALASMGVFVEVADHRFGLTPLAEYLQTEVPGSMRALAIMHGEEHYLAWGSVLHSVKTSETAFDHVFGMGFFQYLTQNPEVAAIFDDAMTGYTAQVSTAVVAAYDFSQFGTIVDVGGGYGTLITAILKANPTMKGVLFDLPHVAEDAKKRIEVAGLTGRCEVVAGDFFASVPSSGDAYLLKWIIHDWDEERAVAILNNCYRAMTENSKLLLVEAVIPHGNTPFFHKFMDLTMLVIAGGRERTEAEYRALLEAAGFRLTQIIPTPSEMSVIEAVRA